MCTNVCWIYTWKTRSCYEYPVSSRHEGCRTLRNTAEHYTTSQSIVPDKLLLWISSSTGELSYTICDMLSDITKKTGQLYKNLFRQLFHRTTSVLILTIQLFLFIFQINILQDFQPKYVRNSCFLQKHRQPTVAYCVRVFYFSPMNQNVPR